MHAKEKARAVAGSRDCSRLQYNNVRQVSADFSRRRVQTAIARRRQTARELILVAGCIFREQPQIARDLMRTARRMVEVRP
jgi:hypothetical protein